MTDEAILIGGSRIEPRVSFLRPVSAAISIGTGGSSLRARGGRTNVRALPVDASPEALGHVSRARLASGWSTTSADWSASSAEDVSRVASPVGSRS
jgi:hypothetical protein